jgi:hypothetical protein
MYSLYLIEKKSKKTNLNVSTLLAHLNSNLNTNIHIYILADTDINNSNSIFHIFILLTVHDSGFPRILAKI